MALVAVYHALIFRRLIVLSLSASLELIVALEFQSQLTERVALTKIKYL